MQYSQNFTLQCITTLNNSILNNFRTTVKKLFLCSDELQRIILDYENKQEKLNEHKKTDTQMKITTQRVSNKILVVLLLCAVLVIFSTK